MPRYFINVYNQIDAIDPEGQIYPDLNDAKDDAMRAAREIIAEDLLQGRPIVTGFKVQIVDEAGKICDTVMFSDVVDCRAVLSSE